MWGNSLFESLSNIEKDLKQYFGLFMFVIIRKIFKSGLYSSQDSIKMSHLWTRTIFELGLYSSQASINDSTVWLLHFLCHLHSTQLSILTLSAALFRLWATHSLKKGPYKMGILYELNTYYIEIWPICIVMEFDIFEMF